MKNTTDTVKHILGNCNNLYEKHSHFVNINNDEGVRYDTQHNDTQLNDIQHNSTLNVTLSMMTLSIMAEHCYA